MARQWMSYKGYDLCPPLPRSEPHRPAISVAAAPRLFLVTSASPANVIPAICPAALRLTALRPTTADSQDGKRGAPDCPNVGQSIIRLQTMCRRPSGLLRTAG